MNNDGRFGRWAFAEFTEVYQIESDFEAKVEAEFNQMIEDVTVAGQKPDREGGLSQSDRSLLG